MPSNSGTRRLYHNADVYTVDPTRPTAEAVAVEDGMIVAVGDESECRMALQHDCDTLDLQGATLLPGFIDTHLHPTVLAFFESNVRLNGVRDIADLRSRIADLGTRRTDDDDWLVGLEFDEQRFSIDRHDLDAACADKPIVVLTRDGHTAMGNSLALQRCNVTRNTPVPEGGRIETDQHGQPTGVMRETAARILIDAMPVPKMEYLLEGSAKSFAQLSAHGITSIGAILQTEEEGPSGASGAFDTAFMSMLLDSAPFNCCSWLIASDNEPLRTARQSPLHSSDQHTHRVAGLKIFADGTFGSRTALMSRPFADAPDNTGFLVHSEEEIYRRMVLAHTEGMQIAIHAIGDAANRCCVDLYERLLNEHPRPDHRHRLEHASLLRGDIIRDIARLGIVVATQPLFIHSEKDFLPDCLGPERTGWVYPIHALLDAGVRVAGASDAPIESTDVLHAIEVCVARDGFEPRQGITAPEAIACSTSVLSSRPSSRIPPRAG